MQLVSFRGVNIISSCPGKELRLGGVYVCKYVTVSECVYGVCCVCVLEVVIVWEGPVLNRFFFVFFVYFLFTERYALGRCS